MRSVQFGNEARAELNQAVLWYAERSTRAAQAMTDEVGHLTTVLPEWPRSYPVLDVPDTSVEVRRALLQTFPYAIAYVVLEAEIRVIAVAHLKRAPLYWIARLGQLR